MTTQQEAIEIGKAMDLMLQHQADGAFALIERLLDSREAKGMLAKQFADTLETAWYRGYQSALAMERAIEQWREAQTSGAAATYDHHFPQPPRNPYRGNMRTGEGDDDA